MWGRRKRGLVVGEEKPNLVGRSVCLLDEDEGNNGNLRGEEFASGFSGEALPEPSTVIFSRLHEFRSPQVRIEQDLKMNRDDRSYVFLWLGRAFSPLRRG